MSQDPYSQGKVTGSSYAHKTDVTGYLVVVLHGRMADRGLELIKPFSRCVLKHQIHELIFTDEKAVPGNIVNRIAYLGFCAIEHGGVIVSGDPVYLDGRLIGRLAGFDETHMPNHLNIVIETATLLDGTELSAELGHRIVFKGK